MLIRRIGAATLLLIGLLACAYPFGSRALIEHAVAKSRVLDLQFRSTAHEVERFRHANGRLPSVAELDVALPQEARGPYQVELQSGGSELCDSRSAAYRKVQSGDYVLMAWRGEWMECFAPSKHISTLSLNLSDSTLLGAIERDEVAGAFIALACVLLSIWLWRRRAPPATL